MADYTRQVLHLLAENGCYFVRRGKGSHNIWYSPILNRLFTVVAKIENRHTANGILSDAGIKAKV
jgi:predicted RNA binding protein YcfA (HicA-like mRNA interferase family)